MPVPTVQKRAPVVQVRQPVPSRVIAEPTPVAVEKPLPAAPVAVEPEPVAALPIPAPAVAPPAPIFTPPSPPALSAPPIFPAPAVYPRRSDPACRVVAVDPALAEVLAWSAKSVASTASTAAAVDAPSSAVDSGAGSPEDAVARPAEDAIPCPTVDSGARDSPMEAGPVVATAPDSGDVSFAVPVPDAARAIQSIRRLSIAASRARTNNGRILGPALSVWGCPADRKLFLSRSGIWLPSDYGITT